MVKKREKGADMVPLGSLLITDKKALRTKYDSLFLACYGSNNVISIALSFFILLFL